MSDVLWTAQTYARLVGVRLRGQMQYRLSFFLLALGSFLGTGIDLIALVFLMQRVPHMDGWSLSELAFLYGAASLSFALAEMTFAGFDGLPLALQRGDFDQVLVRPLGAFVQTLAADVQPHRIGRLVQGLAALLLAIQLTPIPWTAAKVAYLPVMVVSGAAIF